MEANEIAARCSRMWAKLGRQFEQTAYSAASSGSCLDRPAAIAFAKAAEACFWQASGDSDCFDLERGPVK